MTFSTSTDNIPYSATCFYAYDEKENILIFASDEETKHIQNALKNKFVAGAIFLNTKNIAKIKGVQFQGVFIKDLKKEKEDIYFKKFPFSLALKPKLWGIELFFIKMSDNSLGFGKKIVWKRD